MNKKIKRGFSLSGLLAFDPDQAHDHSIDIIPPQVSLPSADTNNTFNEATLVEVEPDSNNQLDRFVKLRNVDITTPTVNLKFNIYKLTARYYFN